MQKDYRISKCTATFVDSQIEADYVKDYNKRTKKKVLICNLVAVILIGIVAIVDVFTLKDVQRRNVLIVRGVIVGCIALFIILGLIKGMRTFYLGHFFFFKFLVSLITGVNLIIVIPVLIGTQDSSGSSIQVPHALYHPNVAMGKRRALSLNVIFPHHKNNIYYNSNVHVFHVGDIDNGIDFHNEHDNRHITSNNLCYHNSAC